MFGRTELSCESMGEAAELRASLWTVGAGTLVVLTFSLLPALVVALVDAVTSGWL